MAVTTLVAIFKTEKDFVTDTGAAVHLSIVKTYKLLFRVMKLPSTKMLVLIVITVEVSTLYVIHTYILLIFWFIICLEHLRRQITRFELNLLCFPKIFIITILIPFYQYISYVYNCRVVIFYFANYLPHIKGDQANKCHANNYRYLSQE